MDRLLIVDGHACAYRAFHAIRDLRAPSGRPTNAIYGFIKMLARMRADTAPTHCVVVWDGGLSEQRLAVLPEYKAQRPEMPDDLRSQLDGIVSYLQASNVASFVQEGVEADDYIACVTRRAVAAGMAVIIASPDKDFMQLVSERVGLLNPQDAPRRSASRAGKAEAVWTEAQVRAKTGVAPGQIVDWLSLRGDSVDNIAGVPGVGPKTAADLLQQFGSVEKMYERLGEVKAEKLRAALAVTEADVRRNRGLVRLRDDLPCAFSPEALAVGKPADTRRLRELYQQWGFKSLLAAAQEPVQERQAVLI